MRRWMVPALLAVIVAPCVGQALAGCAALLASDPQTSLGAVLLDVLQGTLAVGLALALLRFFDEPRAPVWLWDRRVLGHGRHLAGSGLEQGDDSRSWR